MRFYGSVASDIDTIVSWGEWDLRAIALFIAVLAIGMIIWEVVFHHCQRKWQLYCLASVVVLSVLAGVLYDIQSPNWSIAFLIARVILGFPPYIVYRLDCNPVER